MDLETKVSTYKINNICTLHVLTAGGYKCDVYKKGK